MDHSNSEIETKIPRSRQKSSRPYMLGELGLTTDRGDRFAQRRAETTRLSGDQRKREGPVIVDPDRSGTLMGPAQSSSTLLRRQDARFLPTFLPTRSAAPVC